MPTLELSVVVVNYNAGAYLARCLDSVAASSGVIPLEVVVVDNGSRDGSARVAAERSEVRLIENRANLGFAAAANIGIRATEGTYVFLLNPDAQIVSGTLAGFVKVADEHPDAGAVGPLVRNPDGTLQPSARRVPGTVEALMHAFLGPMAPENRWTRSYTLAGWDRSSEREVDWVSGSAMLVRRAALHQVGVFDEGYFMYVEDVDLCTRLRRAGWRVLFSPELEVAHEVGVSARGQSRRMAREHSRSIYRYFTKHRAVGPGRLLTPFVRAALALRTELVVRRRS
ncbi:MAG TPA: glycosyltransferase family 2 protein [Actinomycetota bacterium]|nr:glycosyltransferase family 2 protein [Actinomycetota bacterium]